MITDSMASGCSVYDLRGISDNLTAGDHLLGLVQFKVGTGATPRNTSANGTRAATHVEQGLRRVPKPPVGPARGPPALSARSADVRLLR